MDNIDGVVRLKVLEKVLQSLDTDIISVEKSDISNSYVIRKKIIRK